MQPNQAESWNNLGSTYQYDGEFTTALPYYERALQLSPTYKDALRNVAMCYRSQGNLPAARIAFARALQVGDDAGLRLQAAVCIPAIPESVEQIAETRGQLDAALAELDGVELHVTDPVKEIGVNHFYLAYQGYNDRDLNVRLANLYRRAMPELRYVAPHCRQAVGLPRGRPVRIGFVSAYFHQHSVGRLMAGLIAQLSRSAFHVTVIRLPGVSDVWSKKIDAVADAVLRTSKFLPRAREQIAEQEFDILLYAEIGMDALNYFLAFARLAPVQCVTWGHPVTSGIPEIDYFISSRDLEPDDAQTHYSEQLVRLSAPPTYFYPLPSCASRNSRTDFGLDPQARWYLCNQSVFKIHPDFDTLLGRILAHDPRGHLILISPKEPAWRDSLLARFRRTMPEASDRVRFIPRLSTDELVRLIELADVVLDTTHFSGGLTTIEALSVGQPVVTLPGVFMRGRVTTAYYRQIGVSEMLAQDADDYVRLALRVADDGRWRNEVRQEIRASLTRLYENLGVVRELEQFLLDALGRAERRP
jgi:predicted O-linked N-acetylglucosamine transferase (SPINDLY family)